MITASHNPPSDNAVKVYWSTGGQLLSPHDSNCIEHVYKVKSIRRTAWAEGMASGQIVYCEEDVDPAFVRAVIRQSTGGPAQSPDHLLTAARSGPIGGVPRARGRRIQGRRSLRAARGRRIRTFQRAQSHCQSGKCGRIRSDHRASQADRTPTLIMATDPDCDRLGCAAPLSTQPGAEWATLTGNQIGALLTDSLLAARQAAGTLATKSLRGLRHSSRPN